MTPASGPNLDKAIAASVAWEVPGLTNVRANAYGRSSSRMSCTVRPIAFRSVMPSWVGTSTKFAYRITDRMASVRAGRRVDDDQPCSCFAEAVQRGRQFGNPALGELRCVRVPFPPPLRKALLRVGVIQHYRTSTGHLGGHGQVRGQRSLPNTALLAGQDNDGWPRHPIP